LKVVPAEQTAVAGGGHDPLAVLGCRARQKHVTSDIRLGTTCSLVTVVPLCEFGACTARCASMANWLGYVHETQLDYRGRKAAALH